MLHHFVVDNFIHYLKPLDSFLLRNPNILLFQRNRSERVVEEEQTAVKVDAEKPCNVTVVWQSGRQCHQSHVLLCRLNVTDRPVNISQLINFVERSRKKHINSSYIAGSEI